MKATAANIILNSSLDSSIESHHIIHETVLSARLAGQDQRKTFAASESRLQPALRPANPLARPTQMWKKVRVPADG